MTRLWTALCFASILQAAMVRAQQPDTGSGTDSVPEAPTIAPSEGATSSPLPSGAGPTTPSENPALSAGVSSGAAPAPVSFALPGGQTVTAGEGRFAQPPFRFSVTLAQGFDDNVLTTPSNAVKQVAITQTVLVSEQKQVFTGRFRILPGPVFVPIFVTVTNVVPKTVTVQPAVPAPKKISSAVTNARVSFQAQAISSRTLYTFDASLGALYYYNRPGGSTDYNGSLGLTFLHRINPRTTVSTQADVVYSSQPDFSRINTPTRQTADSSYLSANARVDLTHQWTPRISTDTSYTFTTTLDESQNSASPNDYVENGLNTEFRYLWTPRLIGVIDLRETEASHPNDPTQDSTNSFVLLGVDYAATQRLRTTIRGGEEIRVLSQSSTTLSTPYVETSTAYLFPRGTTLNWTNRFGFEESGSATQERLSYRTNLGLNYVLGPRLTAILGIAYNRSSTTTIGDSSLEAIIEDQIQASLGLTYVVSRTLSLSLSITRTQLITTLPNQDYSRDQIFLGGTFAF